jgi:bacillithiol biosynthesis cysteine-adding enzyme BshC
MRPSVFTTLLAGDPVVRGFFPRDFRDEAAWVASAEAASTRRLRPEILSDLRRQSRALPPSAARDRHVALLAEPGTSVVVTGQQVGLFGGPLYTLHKAATIVARARWLAVRTGRPSIPIFWLQTEDHDYAEIRKVATLAPAGPVTLALPAESEATRTSVAHRFVPDAIENTFSELEAALGSLPHASAVLALLRTHYVPGCSLAAAFAGVIAELFRDEGLVVFDPRTPAVAKASAPLFARVIAEHPRLCAALEARCQAIQDAGCEVQVPSRPGTSLLFFHPRGEAGPRYRLVAGGAGFETPVGGVDTATLLALLEREPLRFSTSALLRPLVQDTLLPTAAYVGGPAEVSYFAELSPIYEALDVTMPVVAPRARLRLLEPTVRSLLDRLGIAAVAVETKKDALLVALAARGRGERTDAALAARLVDPLHRELDALETLGLHDLVAPIRRAREACAKTLEGLASKVERALAERDRVLVERVDRVTAAIHPNETPQERAYGFLAIAARVGIAPMIRAILDAAGAFDPNPRDVLL